MEQSANLCIQLKQVSHCAKLWLVQASRTSNSIFDYFVILFLLDPDPKPRSPDPGKSSGSNRIRINNFAFSGELSRKKKIPYVENYVDLGSFLCC